VGNGSSAHRFKWPSGAAKVSRRAHKETAFQGGKLKEAWINRLGKALQVVESLAATGRNSTLDVVELLIFLW